MFDIGIVNKSSQVSDSDLAAWVPALQKQIGRDFAPVWGIYALISNPAQPVQYQKRVFPLYIVDEADVPGALGYHDVDVDGVPLMKVFVNVSKQAGVPLPSVMSHEILEVLGDAYIETLTLRQDPKHQAVGRLYYAEVCDPVEADLYEINGVQVSNFVTPWWFNPAPPAGKKIDFLGNLSKPFTLTSGGYFIYADITRHGLGPWKSVAGDKARFWNGKDEHI